MLRTFRQVDKRVLRNKPQHHNPRVGGSNPSSATNFSMIWLDRLSFFASGLLPGQSPFRTADCIRRQQRIDHAQLSARQERR
jgi:hypothetical protein